MLFISPGSKNKCLVGPGSPLRKFLERAAVDPGHQLASCDSARIHAAAADANDAGMFDDGAQHDLYAPANRAPL